MTSIERLMTYADAPAAPPLPTMPPSGRITAIVADLGLAMGGTSNAAYCAFAWRWARDEVALQALKTELHTAAQAMALRRRWPPRMHGIDYIPRLCWLALWEEHNWWWIRQGKAWPRLVEIEDEIWNHRVADKYEAVRDVLDGWCASAAKVARLRTADLDDLVDAKKQGVTSTRV